MCTGKCSRCIAVTLYPLVLLSILCNILLFFPGWDVQYVKDGNITAEVYYMGGIVGGGLVVLIPALYIHLTGEQGCCGNRCGMLLSVAVAAVGVAGALYSFTAAMLGLTHGPFCKTYLGYWMTPFENSKPTYLTHSDRWAQCVEPKRVVQFNVGLFGSLLVVSCLQGVLCLVQMINGLFGCLFGTCSHKEEP